MATKQKQKRRSTPHWHLTSRECQVIAFVTTLVVASIAINLRINDSVVWGFLGTAIGISIGLAARSNRNR